MVTVDDVRSVLADLPRSYEVVVRGRIKFRVGQIVYVAFSKDETEIGFGFPREEREYLVASDPETFMMPGESDLRFQWVGGADGQARVRRDARPRHLRMEHVRPQVRLGAVRGQQTLTTSRPPTAPPGFVEAY